MKVFIADRSKLVCERLTSMLTKVENVEIVGVAHDVQTLTEFLEIRKPDVVIVDNKLFGESGMSFFQRIKYFFLVPILVLLTNNSYPQYRHRYISAGADYIFDKATEFQNILNIFAPKPLQQVA